MDFSSVMNAVQSSFLEEEPLMLDLVADNNVSKVQKKKKKRKQAREV